MAHGRAFHTGLLPILKTKSCPVIGFPNKRPAKQYAGHLGQGMVSALCVRVSTDHEHRTKHLAASQAGGGCSSSAYRKMAPSFCALSV